MRSYGKYLWLDPGEREVQEYSLSVVMDVVKRYDIDGVQFDDYFYPTEPNAAVNWIFRTTRVGRNMARRKAESRRLAARKREHIHRARLHVPSKREAVGEVRRQPRSGIWRPGNPAADHRFDAYDKLYADSRKWLVNGWVDYFAPQLYWPIEQGSKASRCC